MLRRVLKGILLGLVVMTLAVIAFAIFTHQGRVMVKSALFIPQVLTGNPVKPLQWFTRAPMVEEVTFPTPSGTGVADLYRPRGGGKHGAVVLFLGVNPAGRDDERVVNLGKGLARAGMVVMIPWSPSMIEKRIEPGEVDNLVSVFQYLQSLAYVDSKRVGMGGFCVGASIAFVAASRKEIREEVAFVNFFGGYFDAADLIKAVASRQSHYRQDVKPWEPNDLTIEVVTTHLVQGLSEEGERELLTRIFIHGQGVSDEVVQGLSSEAGVVYRLLKGVDLETAEELMGQLPAATLERLREISPSQYLSQVHARVLIMHDREDDLVPVEESRRLSDALSSRGNVYYTELSSFQHVTPSIGFTLVGEMLKLYNHFYNIFVIGA